MGREPRDADRKRPRRGRPPKFEGPRRRISLTLPERTLERLAAVHGDVAHAIVKVVDGAPGPSSPPVTLAEVAPGLAIIVVGHSVHLQRIPWLRLAEISPAGFLLSIPSGTAVEALEVAIGDLLATVPPDEERERLLLESLLEHIRHSRRGLSLSKTEILVVETDSPRSS